MSGRAKKRAIIVGALVVALFGSWFFAFRPGSSTLEVRFIGWTNNPQVAYTPIRVCVTPPDATGNCALFQVTNTRKTGMLWFATTAIETREGATWKTWRTRWNPYRGRTLRNDSEQWRGVEGSSWLPGTSMLYAIGVPEGLPSTSVWRMRVSVALEPTGFRRSVNEKMGQTVFRLYSWHAVTTSEVPAQ